MPPVAHRRAPRDTGTRRPYPRASMDDASCSERSKALSSTGTAIPRSPAKPRTGRPRRRLASRTSAIDHHQFGGEGEGDGDGHPRLVQDGRQAAQQPVRAGQRVRGPEAEQHHGEPQALDEGDRARPRRVTGPPMLTPSAHDGRGTWGRVNRTWPGRRFPNRITRTTRSTMTTRPSRRKTTSERDHGADGPAGRHHEGDHAADQQQQDRVGGARRGTGHAGRPQPPGPGVEPPATRAGRRRSGSSESGDLTASAGACATGCRRPPPAAATRSPR